MKAIYTIEEPKKIIEPIKDSMLHSFSKKRREFLSNHKVQKKARFILSHKVFFSFLKGWPVKVNNRKEKVSSGSTIYEKAVA